MTRKRDIKQFQQACKEVGLTVRERYEADMDVILSSGQGEMAVLRR